MKYINSLDEALAIITPEECLQPCVITDPTARTTLWCI
jgi:hypothetical protein